MPFSYSSTDDIGCYDHFPSLSSGLSIFGSRPSGFDEIEPGEDLPKENPAANIPPDLAKTSDMDSPINFEASSKYENKMTCLAHPEPENMLSLVDPIYVPLDEWGQTRDDIPLMEYEIYSPRTETPRDRKKKTSLIFPEAPLTSSKVDIINPGSSDEPVRLLTDWLVRFMIAKTWEERAQYEANRRQRPVALPHKDSLIEASHSLFYPQSNWRPRALRSAYFLTLILLTILSATIQLVLISKGKWGLPVSKRASKISEISDSDHFAFSLAKWACPVSGIVIGLMWDVIDRNVRGMEVCIR